MDSGLARFRRKARQRIAETFPATRLPFLQSLRVQPAFSAFGKIKRIVANEERAWQLFLLALHVLYEGWHDLPPLSAGERKTLLRNTQSLRAVARRLRGRRLRIEDNSESAALERIADQLEWIVCPSVDGVYNPKSSWGARFDPRDAIPVFELAKLFRQRLAGNAFYPIIVDLMNTVPGRPKQCNVRTIKDRLARLEGAGFQPRVQFVYQDGGVVTLKFRNAHPGPVTSI